MNKSREIVRNIVTGMVGNKTFDLSFGLKIVYSFLDEGFKGTNLDKSNPLIITSVQQVSEEKEIVHNKEKTYLLQKGAAKEINRALIEVETTQDKKDMLL